jgi:hypothetical protein
MMNNAALQQNVFNFWRDYGSGVLPTQTQTTDNHVVDRSEAICVGVFIRL